MNETNWYVVTGGPYAGKTKMIGALRERGHVVEEEAARAYIDQELGKGRTIEAIRADEAFFQQEILNKKLERHAALSPDAVVFFDRGIPDTIAYLRANNAPIPPGTEEVMNRYPYRKVFLLDMVGHAIDHARVESPELAARIHEELYKAYTELGIPVVRVPVTTLEERIEFVLGNL